MDIKKSQMLDRTILNDKLPTIFDDEYSRINKFERYEYTHCIVYEFARRNSYVENAMNLLYDLFLYYEQIILPTLSKYEKATITDDMIEAINIYKKFFKGLVHHYHKEYFTVDFESLTFESIKEKISYLANTLAKELYDDYYIIYQYESETDFKEIYNPLAFLERDNELTRYVSNTYHDADYLKKYKSNYSKNKYFTILQDIDRNKKDFNFNTIYPNFSTALRDFTNTKIALNLNLPKDEIIDYIEKIKNNYDSEDSIIKTPMQILEKELEINNNINETNKWGDILFIYDYYHSCQLFTGKNKSEIVLEIQMELTKYHGLKIKKTSDEIKNKKDTKYKQVSWAEHIENNPEDEQAYVNFDKDIKPYLSTRAIENKYNLIKKYIEGNNPKYKTLINRDIL